MTLKCHLMTGIDSSGGHKHLFKWFNDSSQMPQKGILVYSGTENSMGRLGTSNNTVVRSGAQVSVGRSGNRARVLLTQAYCWSDSTMSPMLQLWRVQGTKRSIGDDCCSLTFTDLTVHWHGQGDGRGGDGGMRKRVEVDGASSTQLEDISSEDWSWTIRAVFLWGVARRHDVEVVL